MENVKFSIVMPVFNVEKYLKESVESVLSQDLKPYEVILVDDCSTDKSNKIANEIAEKHDNVLVLNLEKNGGLSNARNKGFEYVKGDYVLFLDSDDKVEPSLLSSIKASLEKNRADVVLFGLVEDYYDKDGNIAKSRVVKAKKDEYLSSAIDVQRTAIELERQTLYGYAWNKAYSVAFLKSIAAKFKDVTLIEDITFNVEVFDKLNSLNIISAPLYHYMRRIDDGNLTSKFLPNYFELNKSRVAMLLAQQKKWNVCDDNARRILANILVRYTFSALQRNCDKRAKMNLKSRFCFLKSLYNDKIYKELISYAEGESIIYKIMVFSLKHKFTLLLLLLGRIIFIVKEKLPILFSLLKAQK